MKNLKYTFWEEFIEYSKDNDGIFADNSPVEHSYIGKAIDSSLGVCMWAVIGVKFARIEVYINSGDRELNKACAASGTLSPFPRSPKRHRCFGDGLHSDTGTFYNVTPVLKMAISRQPFLSLLTGSPEATFRM